MSRCIDQLLPLALISIKKKKTHTHAQPSASSILIKVPKAALISWKCQGTLSEGGGSWEKSSRRNGAVCVRLSIFSPLKASSNRSAPVVIG